MIDEGRPLPQPRQGKYGGPDRGPRNLPVELENPDLMVAPRTDHGTVPNLKWPFAMSHTRMEEGGWTRETTVRELPVATELAGVQFGLEPGGYREVHWRRYATARLRTRLGRRTGGANRRGELAGRRTHVGGVN